jgi:hypothetical protein
MVKTTVEPTITEVVHDDAFARNLERVAWAMDRAVGVPGTKIRVGLDALLGLLPIGGDVATGLVQIALVLAGMWYYRVPKSVAARMMANVLLDVAVGAIPILGDLFDVGFKANTRNMKLLEPYGHHPTLTIGERLDGTKRGTPWRLILPVGAVLLLVLGLVLVGFVTVVRWLFQF